MTSRGDNEPGTAAAVQPVVGQAQLAELAALLISSAETSLVEPRKYPVYRLVDAAQLVAGWAAQFPDGHPGWADLERHIAQGKDLMLWDVGAFDIFVRSLSSWLLEHVISPSAAAAPPGPSPSRSAPSEKITDGGQAI